MTEQEFINQIENSITEINSINFSNSWAYEQVINSIFKIQFLPIILFTYPKGSSIFRSRINIGTELFENVSDISIPDEKYVTEYKRANKPKQSLFYGSEDRPTSYLEFVEQLAENTPIGNEVAITVGKWKTKRELTLALVFNPQAERNISYYQQHGEALDEVIKKSPEEFRKGTTKFYEFIGNEFAKNAGGDIRTYQITCAYSNIVFAHEKTDGIMYPSVARGGDGFNIALKKNIITENLIIIETAKIDKFIAQRQENGKHEFVNKASMDSSGIRNKRIKWKHYWLQHF
jgi:hypothetical protein